MKFEIKSRWTGSVLFSVETETLKLAVELGVQSGADLRGADLRGVDLRGVNLRGVNLRGADLRGADLRDADLRDADLRAADLRGVHLYAADLGGVNLYRANLYGADLYGADLGDNKFPIQILGHRHFLQTTADGKLQIGCHTHTLDGWIKNAEKIGEIEGYSSFDIEIYKLHIEHIAKVARLLWKREGE